jgi:excisionase family DNA binding protein
MPETDALTIHELAVLLRIGLRPTYALAQNGEVPGIKVGGPWRSRRRDIEAWIDNQARRSSQGRQGER